MKEIDPINYVTPLTSNEVVEVAGGNNPPPPPPPPPSPGPVIFGPRGQETRPF